MSNVLSPAYKRFIEGELPEYASRLTQCLETTEPSVSVRINPLKGTAETAGVVPAFADGAVPWCADGVYLGERPDFTHDPALHQGVYYVQDASSMALWRVARMFAARVELPAGEALRYLDACAAPGGKTTAAIAALPQGSLVVANEFDFRRAEILKENVIKWGYEAAVVSRGDTACFRRLPGWFHIVAADVPCSGEGMMRKDAKACGQWSEGLVDECAARQRTIVSNLWECLAPGGYMIYSTCTFNRRENEDVMAWMAAELGAEPVMLPEADFPGAVATESMLRFLPGLVRGEGLAIGVVRKPDGGGEVGRRDREPKRKGGRHGGGAQTDGAARRMAAECGRWLGAGHGMEVRISGEEVSAVPAVHAAAVERLTAVLDVIHSGVALGTVKGKSVVPSHALAMSVAFERGAFPEVEVDLPLALSYLRRESLGGFDGVPRGVTALTYGGRVLGFANNLGNRANNLYPAAWRILH